MTYDEMTWARARVAHTPLGADPYTKAMAMDLDKALDEIERLRGVLERISVGHHSGTPENDALAGLDDKGCAGCRTAHVCTPQPGSYLAMVEEREQSRRRK